MEDDQQFCLRWNNHQSTLIQNFDTLLESGTLVDCTLAAEGKYLKAHKVVLSACSPYFEGLLSEHYDKHPVFILKDVKFKELKAMMDYMYRGEVNISQDQLAALLKAAESLQIKGLSESKTSGSSKTDSRQQKVVPQTSQPDIPISSSGLTIEKNKVPRQGVSQGPLGDLPEDSASPQIPKGLSSREGSQSPTSRKRKRFRRKSIGDDNSVENHEASNSSDMPQQMGVPALGIAPVADEKSHADPTDSIGRSALMTQLTKPADEMLQLPLEKPEPSDNLIEPKSEYLEDPEESVEDLTLDDDMNDLNEMEQDNNRAGPSHDPSQHPAGIGAWHVTGDRSNAGGVVGSVAGAPGTTDEVFLAAQEAAQAHRDSQGCVKKRATTSSLTRRKKQQASEIIEKSERNDSWGSEDDFMQIDLNEWDNDGDSITSNGRERNDGNEGNENTSKRNETARYNKENNRNNDENCEGDSGSSSSITDLSTNEGWMQPLNQLPSIPINCRYCEKTFSRPANLARHEKNNCLKNEIAKCHTERNANPFVCMECGARFKHKKALNYHVRHMCQRSAECNICHKNFTGRVVPARHLRMCQQKHMKKIECVSDNEDQKDLLNSDSFVISEISDDD
ncbi:longitudinals lacking protein, isoforms H/M/V-like isoform X3 [Bombus pascuorum]|uniref:longitudinals lacking protein, isoforms H/M/V-like isoform X3 n=1 Tax=Bombus pascuorum TaxID=65598 RepID=UPI00298E1BE5|nr:longitudinals lacking protein, isoforms H/M/V-like isoform X3 [Bombus pascuorum]